MVQMNIIIYKVTERTFYRLRGGIGEKSVCMSVLKFPNPNSSSDFYENYIMHIYFVHGLNPIDFGPNRFAHIKNQFRKSDYTMNFRSPLTKKHFFIQTFDLIQTKPICILLSAEPVLFRNFIVTCLTF